MSRFEVVRQILLVTCLSVTVGAQTSYLLQTLAGSDEVGDGGPPLAALLAHAEGLAIDSAGVVYISDADAHRVRRVAPGGLISTVAGTGHAGFSGDGVSAVNATLNTPYGLATDHAGNLYIADLGNSRIRRVSPDGIISTVAGGGLSTGVNAEGHPAIEAALKSPRNVTLDTAGNLYFSDFADQKVYQVSTNGILLRMAGNGVAGFSGDNGSAYLAQLNSPAGLAIDSSGTLYIADSANARIRKVWRGVISTAGDTGKPGAPSAIPAFGPTAVIVDTDGSLIIANSWTNQILRVTPLMQLTTISQPARDIAIDAAGNIYSCSGPYVYRRLRAGTLSIFAGNGSYAFWGDGGQAHKARLNQPSGIARDESGALYIADRDNNRVRKVLPDGTIFTIVGTGTAGAAGDHGPAAMGQLNGPTSVTVDGAGNLYISDTFNHRIRRVDGAGILTTAAGTGDRGFAGDGGLAVLARLDTPGGIALDSSGNLFIADTGNHIVRRLARNGTITTFAGNANRGFAGDGGLPQSATLNAPTAVTFDPSGNLFIADTGNHRIRRVSAPGAFGPGLINSYPPGDTGTWKAPRGMNSDSSGNLFVADALDQRVYVVDVNGRITTVAGDGWLGFNGDSSPALTARLDTPTDLIVDPAGNIFLTDSGNGRLRKLSPVIEVVAPPPVVVPPSIVNAASMLPGAVAPGEIVSLFGSGLAVVGGSTQVLFNGRAAALSYVEATQINLQVPYSVPDLDKLEVQVLVNGVVKVQFNVGLVAAIPGIFTGMSGTGQVIALNEDGTINSPGNPAARGSVVTMFATGDGRVTPQPGDGVPAVWPYPAPLLPVTLRIGDYSADILYAQAAPGFAGLMQINARVPGGFAPSGILPVTLQVGTAASQAGVVIAVR